MTNVLSKDCEAFCEAYVKFFFCHMLEPAVCLGIHLRWVLFYDPIEAECFEINVIISAINRCSIAQWWMTQVKVITVKFQFKWWLKSRYRVRTSTFSVNCHLKTKHLYWYLRSWQWTHGMSDTISDFVSLCCCL